MYVRCRRAAPHIRIQMHACMHARTHACEPSTARLDIHSCIRACARARAPRYRRVPPGGGPALTSPEDIAALYRRLFPADPAAPAGGGSGGGGEDAGGGGGGAGGQHGVLWRLGNQSILADVMEELQARICTQSPVILSLISLFYYFIIIIFIILFLLND